MTEGEYQHFRTRPDATYVQLLSHAVLTPVLRDGTLLGSHSMHLFAGPNTPEPFDMGRIDLDASNDIAIDSAFRRVSRIHAQIKRTENGWFILDRESKNGTFMDGQKIPPNQWVPLRSGATITMGLLDDHGNLENGSLPMRFVTPEAGIGSATSRLPAGLNGADSSPSTVQANLRFIRQHILMSIDHLTVRMGPGIQPVPFISVGLIANPDSGEVTRVAPRAVIEDALGRTNAWFCVMTDGSEQLILDENTGFTSMAQSVLQETLNHLHFSNLVA